MKNSCETTSSLHLRAQLSTASGSTTVAVGCSRRQQNLASVGVMLLDAI
jgi:hypothetical protein